MKHELAHLRAVVLKEWQTLPLKGLSLSDDDRLLASRLDGELESRISIDEMLDGIRITSRSWVGLVRFHGFEIQIVPKLVGDNLGLVELIDYATGLDALDRQPAARTVEGSGSNLFDLIALLLVESAERILRGGLLSDYCEVEDDLPVVRGRLLVQRQVLKRFGRIERVECRYDEYITNILENQILLAALSVCRNRVVNSAISMRIRRLLAILSEVCDLDGLDLRLSRSSLIYNRMNEHYRESHELAWLILDGLGIEDIFAAGSHRCFAFLLDMNRLFENFVARWLRQVLSRSEFKVIPQRRDRSILWHADKARPYAAVIPDVLIERLDQPGILLPVDAKYKLYDERRVATSDIYQTFLYAYAYGENHSIWPTALVLYPASSGAGSQVRLHIRRKNGETSAEVRAVPIHIPSALTEARMKKAGPVTQSLIELVQKTFAG